MWHKITSVIVGAFWGAALASLLRVSLGLTWDTPLPLWVYLVVGVGSAVLVGLQDWRLNHPVEPMRADQRVQHCLCEICWTELAPQRRPLRARVQHRVFEPCCMCGQTCCDGIYAQTRQQFEHCEH